MLLGGAVVPVFTGLKVVRVGYRGAPQAGNRGTEWQASGLALAHLRPEGHIQHSHLTQVTPMPRKPNYDFERKERERLKSEKNAARAKAKAKPAKDDAHSELPDEDKTSE
jgi:hypothetical protein